MDVRVEVWCLLDDDWEPDDDDDTDLISFYVSGFDGYYATPAHAIADLIDYFQAED
jgi:hypothetical protein